MNERGDILQRLYAVEYELRKVLHCEQELQDLASELREERKLFQTTTMRAKCKQVFAALCVAALGVCALEGLLTFKFEEMNAFVLWAFWAYKFFSPKRYQDKELTIFRAILTLLGALLFWFYVKTLLTVGTRDDISIWYVITRIFYGAAFVIMTVAVYRLLTRKRLAANKKITEMNKVIRPDNNKRLWAWYIKDRKDLARHIQEVQRLCDGWFPMDYCSMYAVQCFIAILQNCQADTVKEMVSLFENAGHKRRMEEAQLDPQCRIEELTLTSILDGWAVQDATDRNAGIRNTINSAATA